MAAWQEKPSLVVLAALFFVQLQAWPGQLSSAHTRVLDIKSPFKDTALAAGRGEPAECWSPGSHPREHLHGGWRAENSPCSGNVQRVRE